MQNINIPLLIYRICNKYAKYVNKYTTKYAEYAQKKIVKPFAIICRIVTGMHYPPSSC